MKNIFFLERMPYRQLLFDEVNHRNITKGWLCYLLFQQFMDVTEECRQYTRENKSAYYRKYDKSPWRHDGDVFKHVFTE
jgi:hypothetical protein